MTHHSINAIPIHDFLGATIAVSGYRSGTQAPVVVVEIDEGRRDDGSEVHELCNVHLSIAELDQFMEQCRVVKEALLRLEAARWPVRLLVGV